MCDGTEILFVVCKEPENCNNDTAQVRFGLYSMAITNINGLFTGFCSEPLNMSVTSEQSVVIELE